MIKSNRQYRLPSYQETEDVGTNVKLPSYEDTDIESPKKKESGGIGSQIGGPVGTSAVQSEEIDPNDIIGLSKKAMELGTKTKIVSGASGETGISEPSVQPDYDAIAQSKQIKSDLGKKGYTEQDVNSLAKDFKDFPEEAFSLKHDNGETPYSKENLLQLRKDNPLEYQSTLNNLKNTYSILKTGGQDAANEYNLYNHASDNFQQFSHNVQRQQDLINHNLTGDERDKALGRLQESSSKFIDPNNPSLQNEYDSDLDLKGKVDINQYAGLKTLEMFDPPKYEQAVKMLGVKITPTYTHELPTEATRNIQAPVAVSTSYENTDPTGGTLSQKTIDSQIGQEAINRQLSEIGRSNAIQNLNTKQYGLNVAFDKSQDPQEKAQIQAQYILNQNAINGIKSDAAKDDDKYPLTAKLKFDQQVKELTQDPGKDAVQYGTERFLHGFGNTGNTLEDKVISMFGSDNANTRLQLRRLGEEKDWQNQMYLPESMKMEGSPAVIKFPKELNDQRDAILNNKDLSETDKKQQLVDLVKNNQSKIDYVTNPDAGKSKNFWSKATLYGTAGTLGDITSIASQSLGMGALGASKMVAAATPMFTTSYSDFYNQAIEEGNPNPSGYASVHAAIMAAAGLINPDINIVKRSLGLNTAIGKTIAGLDEATWNKVLSENKPLLQKFKNAARSSASEALKMGATYGVGTSIANDLADKGFFNKDISGDEMFNHAVNSAKNIVLSSVPLFGLNAITHFRDVSDLHKATLWELGDNPDIGIGKIDEAVANKEITPEQGEQRKDVINKIATLIPQVPTENSKGKPITDSQKADYLYNLFVKDKANELKKSVPEQQKEVLEGKKAQADVENNSIINGKEPKLIQINPEEEKIFNYDSEKDIPDVLSGVKPVKTEEIEGEGGKKIKVTYSGQQLIDSGLAEKPIVTETAKRPESKTEPSTDEIVKNLEQERQSKIDQANKPDIKMPFIKAEDLVKSDDPIRLKQQHSEIRDKFKTLKQIVNCLWG